MIFHGGPRGGWIVRLDPGEYGRMLGDHLRHASCLRQSEPAIAIDMDFHLLDQSPDPRISGDLGDAGMERFIRLMKGVAVARRLGLALTFEDRTQAQNLAGGGAPGGQPRGGLLQRLADDDGFRQRGKRNTRDDDARLGEYFDKTFAGES